MGTASCNVCGAAPADGVDRDLIHRVNASRALRTALESLICEKTKGMRPLEAAVARLSLAAAAFDPIEPQVVHVQGVPGAAIRVDTRHDGVRIAEVYVVQKDDFCCAAAAEGGLGAAPSVRRAGPIDETTEEILAEAARLMGDEIIWVSCYGAIGAVAEAAHQQEEEEVARG